MHTCGGTLPWLGPCSLQEHLEQAGAGRAGLGSGQGSITPRQSRAGASSAPSQLHLPTHGFSASARVAALGEERAGQGKALQEIKQDCRGIWNAAGWCRRLQALRRRWHEVPEPRVGRTSPRDRTGSGRTGKSLTENADKSRELFLSEKTSH